MLVPEDATAAAAMLADAKRDRRKIVPRGAGTKLAWARRAPEPATEMSLLRLTTPLAHYAGDLVATIPAGMTLCAANRVLEQSGQWLPLDPTGGDQATIGGIVATNDSGPRRHRYGAPRDLIIGIEVALTDGRVVRAGGRVVKNVAGYDLSRLFCGSFGSLGVITSATFKLAPITAASRTVVAETGDARRAIELALMIASQPVTPTAIEVIAPGARLLVRFESTARAADQMAAAASGALTEHQARAFVVSGDEEQSLWRNHAGFGSMTDALTLKVSIRPTDLAAVFVALGEGVPAVTWGCSGRAALGVLTVSIAGPDGPVRDVLSRLCQTIHSRQGHVTALDGPASLRAIFDAVSARPTNQALVQLMRDVKSRFDPEGTLAVFA
jgi:glycolate oxidase FAD binding subunit